MIDVLKLLLNQSSSKAALIGAATGAGISLLDRSASSRGQATMENAVIGAALGWGLTRILEPQESSAACEVPANGTLEPPKMLAEVIHLFERKPKLG